MLLDLGKVTFLHYLEEFIVFSESHFLLLLIVIELSIFLEIDVAFHNWLHIFLHEYIWMLLCKRKTEIETFHLLVHSPTCLWYLGQGQAKARSQDFPGEWQGPKYLTHYLLPPRVHISRKLELEADLELKCRHCYVGCQLPKWWLKHLFKWQSAIHVFSNLLNSGSTALLSQVKLRKSPRDILEILIIHLCLLSLFSYLKKFCLGRNKSPNNISYHNLPMLHVPIRKVEFYYLLSSYNTWLCSYSLLDKESPR